MHFAKHLLIFFAFILVSVSTSIAEMRGTPTIVTNDATSPVPVTGTVTAVSSSLYKPVGVTTSTSTDGSNYYALGSMCYSEFQDSRLCSTQEMILAPGRISIPANGVWIYPTPIAVVDGASLASENGFYGYNGGILSNSGGFSFAKHYIAIDGTISKTTSTTIQRNVACCGP